MKKRPRLLAKHHNLKYVYLKKVLTTKVHQGQEKKKDIGPREK